MYALNCIAAGLSYNLQSKSFHAKLASAQKVGRKFSIVPILDGIQADICEDGVWRKERYTFEDALNVVFSES